ncbi:hypothetical protein OEA41_002757 [Lepraria neglecta]|uniref:Uncharacterized protein n=1 Tax=Lepraria neglecta TaxID=209136 RepID=A0AAD9Z336_9LECA|nr:hypothetical protein OEA41_002757 [Lepraria neglecta]
MQRTVRKIMGLKWEMSVKLRRDFLLRNADLEKLNYQFAKSVTGVKIKSYVESNDTSLTVLSKTDKGGKAPTTIRLCIVDSRSGKLSTSDSPVEDEEVIQLNTTHVGAPRFMGESTLYALYIDEIATLVTGFSKEERAAYQTFNNAIMTGIKVDVHQFYNVGNEGEPASMKILSANPSLQNFLKLGPAKCMDARMRGYYQTSPPIDDANIPSIDERIAMEPVQPPSISNYSTTIKSAAEIGPAIQPLPLPTVAILPFDDTHAASDISGASSSLAPNAPAAAPLPHSNAKRPSQTTDFATTRSTDHLVPKPATEAGNPIQSGDQTETDGIHLFPLPSPSSGRFKWIHMPFTHTGWVPHVLTTISEEKKDLSLHSSLLMDQMWSSQHNSSRHASPHARFVKSSVKCLWPKDAEKSPTEMIATPASATNDIQLVVYLPYLHWDSFGNLQKRADIIERRRKQAYARPVPEDVAKGKSLEHKLVWQYLTLDRPIHCRRTLDQYGYPSLRNTSVRDRDQILYKRTRVEPPQQSSKEPATKSKAPQLKAQPKQPPAGQESLPSPSGDDEAAKVLMVDQLWLWIIDESTVVTFFASKEQEDKDRGLRGEGNLRNEIYRDVNGDYAHQCADPFDFAALAVYHAVKVLLDRTIDRNLRAFEIFEEYINILTEQQNASFKRFRNEHGFEKAKNDAESHLDNRKDLDALLELRDIDDELKMIEKLVKEQQECVKDMLKQYQHLNEYHEKGFNGTNFLIQIEHTLTENKERIVSMLASAHVAQTAFKELLDMKQKQASIVEAHLAREQTILTRQQTGAAVEQARIVMIFTIVTIIFLPLSFFASVFGINSREWAQAPNSYPTLNTIFTYMSTISVTVIILALLVAFNRYTRRLLVKVWKYIGLPLMPIFKRIKHKRRRSTDQASAEEGMSALVSALDLEKEAAVHTERAKRLLALSRSYSHMNLEDKRWLKGQGIANGKVA